MHTLTEPGAPPGTGGLREEKKRRTRDALVRSARDLVLERGLDAVTVNQICAAADVAPRTFFNYFETKDAAVLGLSGLKLGAGFVKSYADGGPTGDPAEDLAHLVTQVVVTNLPSVCDLAATLELLHREPRLIAVQMHWMETHRGSLAELVAARQGNGNGNGLRASPGAAATGALAVLTLCRSVLEAAEAAGSPGLDEEAVLVLARTAVQDLRSLVC